ATLDPTVRAVRLPSKRRVLVSDTVGFLRDLPPALIAAFRATLEEVQEASLILQVTDVSNPQNEEQDAAVEKVLKDLGAEGRPRLRVFNKIDLMPEQELSALMNNHADGNVFVSAKTGEGLEELLRRIDECMPVDPLVRTKLRVPMTEGRNLALVYTCGRVLESSVDDGHMKIDAELPESLARRLEEFVEEAAG
ncbi:MAG: GTPase, partial [Candidatus Acidiferrales bacterium]